MSKERGEGEKEKQRDICKLCGKKATCRLSGRINGFLYKFDVCNEHDGDSIRKEIEKYAK